LEAELTGLLPSLELVYDMAVALGNRSIENKAVTKHVIAKDIEKDKHNEELTIFMKKSQLHKGCILHQ